MAINGLTAEVLVRDGLGNQYPVKIETEVSDSLTCQLVELVRAEARKQLPSAFTIVSLDTLVATIDPTGMW